MSFVFGFLRTGCCCVGMWADPPSLIGYARDCASFQEGGSPQVVLVGRFGLENILMLFGVFGDVGFQFVL